MHKGIVTHPNNLSESNIDELNDMDFVFICIDSNNIKKTIISFLEKSSISFIDVGMGIQMIDNHLFGSIRVTASTPDKRKHIKQNNRIPLDNNGLMDQYSTNIQIADLNALNATLAVIKWKKLMGFYADLEKEHHSIFNIDGNHLLNEDI